LVAKLWKSQEYPGPVLTFDSAKEIA
jgi:hypothetical protein